MPYKISDQAGKVVKSSERHFENNCFSKAYFQRRSKPIFCNLKQSLHFSASAIALKLMLNTAI